MNKTQIDEGVKPLTRRIKIILLKALNSGVLTKEQIGEINGFINGRMELKVIDSRLQLETIDDEEFEAAVAKLRRERHDPKLEWHRKELRRREEEDKRLESMPDAKLKQ